MDNRRWIAFFIFTLGVVLLFSSYNAKQQQQRLDAQRKARAEAQAVTSDTLTTADSPDVDSTSSDVDRERKAPGLRAETAEDAAAEEAQPDLDRETAPTIEVRTQSHRVVFSTLGAVPLQWDLVNLTAAAAPNGDSSSSTTISLIPSVYSRQREYPFMIEGRPLELFNDVPFTAQKADLPDGGVDLTLTSEDRKGLRVIKRFQFPKEGYLVPFTLMVANDSEMRKLFSDDGLGLSIGWQGGFMEPEENSRAKGTLLGMVSNAGGLRTETVEAKGEPTTIQGPILWAGVERKFFLAAIIPGKDVEAGSALVTVRERDMTAEYQKKGFAPPVSVVLQHGKFELEPGQTKVLAYHVFVGPKSYDILVKADEATGLGGKTGLAASVFHSTLRVIRWLSLVLLDLLNWLQLKTGSYGFAIILLTILVRVGTYPLTHKSMKIQARTMAQQAKLKPYIDEINKKYKDDPAKKNQAMMKLWKEHGVNPFGMLRGCVPVLLQMPFFIALYYLLDQAIELRGQSFYWIGDLSLPDRLVAFSGFTLPLIGTIDSLNILPILMGLTQVVSSRMSMTAASDPMQRQMMMMMPLIFVFLLYNFPSGLMLYWVVTNLWQIGQQTFTNRLIAKEQAAAAAPARG